MTILALHHFQLAMPEGKADDARAFYSGLLGFNEVEKPDNQSGQDGCWFEADRVKLYVFADPDFTPAKKYRPAILTDNLDVTCKILQGSGYVPREESGIAGFQRKSVSDPFGNDIELMQRVTHETARGSLPDSELWETNGFAEPERIEHRFELINQHREGGFDEIINCVSYFFKDPNDGCELVARAYGETFSKVSITPNRSSVSDQFIEDVLCYLIPRFQEISIIRDDPIDPVYVQPPKELLLAAKRRLEDHIKPKSMVVL